MKAIKENWKLVLIVAAGIIAVIFMCIFGVQGAQNKAFAMEEQVNTADSDIKVQEKRRVDLVYNLADCVKQYDKHEAETLTAIVEGRGKTTNLENVTTQYAYTNRHYNRFQRKDTYQNRNLLVLGLCWQRRTKMFGNYIFRTCLPIEQGRVSKYRTY